MTHKDLVEVAYRWILKNASCGVAFKELKTLSWEIPDVIGFGSSGHSAIIECKISRADFLCDKNKPFRINPALGMGSSRYYCCPKELIMPTDMPDGWGLIYVDEKGKAKLIHKPMEEYTNDCGTTYKRPYRHDKDIKAEHGVMYSALRRLFIKGFVKHIYDKDYSANRDIETLIENNEP